MHRVRVEGVVDGGEVVPAAVAVEGGGSGLLLGCLSAI